MKIQIAIDRPRPNVPLRSYAGYVEVTGWVAAQVPITDIRVRAVGGEWTRACYAQPRPDVEKAYPKLVHADRSGFRAFVPAREPKRLEVRVEAGPKQKTREFIVDVASEIREIAVVDTDPSSCPWCGNESPRMEQAGSRTGPFRLVSCGRCDFAFADPLPSAEEMARIYEIEYRQDSPHGTDVLYASADTDLVCGLVEEDGNGGRRALEIGCGQGTLVYGLQQRGFDIHGQDLSKNAARQIEREAGIPIWRGPLRKLDDAFGGGPYDVIVTRHVIEHSISPRTDLRWMREHLSDDGIIILLTPNHGSLAAEILGPAWEWFVPPIHVGYFSPRSLEVVGDVADLRLCMLRTREGDAASMIPTLKTYLDYEESHLPEEHLVRCRQILSASVEGDDDNEAVGRGQELIAVLAAR